MSHTWNTMDSSVQQIKSGEIIFLWKKIAKIKLLCLEKKEV